MTRNEKLNEMFKEKLHNFSKHIFTLIKIMRNNKKKVDACGNPIQRYETLNLLFRRIENSHSIKLVFSISYRYTNLSFKAAFTQTQFKLKLFV